jgi:hypothetical protein
MGRHDHNAVRQIHSLRDVVSHIYHRLARFTPHIGKQALHVVAGERVQSRERLIHQQHGRIVRQRASNGDPLLHPTGKVVRIRTCKLLQLHEAQLLAGNPVAFFFCDAFHFQPERDIAECRAPGEKLGEVLKHNAPIHPAACHRLAADADLAGNRRKKARYNVE